MSQTITRGGPRSQIAIPAQGLVEFRDALTDLLDEFGDSDGGYAVKMSSTSSHIQPFFLSFLVSKENCPRDVTCESITKTFTSTLAKITVAFTCE